MLAWAFDLHVELWSGFLINGKATINWRPCNEDAVRLGVSSFRAAISLGCWLYWGREIALCEVCVWKHRKCVTLKWRPLPLAGNKDLFTHCSYLQLTFFRRWSTFVTATFMMCNWNTKGLFILYLVHWDIQHNWPNFSSYNVQKWRKKCCFILLLFAKSNHHHVHHSSTCQETQPLHNMKESVAFQHLVSTRTIQRCWYTMFSLLVSISLGDNKTAFYTQHSQMCSQ